MARTTRRHERLPEHERYIYGEGDIQLNQGKRRASLAVRNTGDRAIQVCSHYHFFEANRALSFDRDAAFGMHLDLPAGNAIRIEPGDTHRVDLVEYGGGLRVYGFSGLVDGSVRAGRTHRVALERMNELGFLDVPVKAKAAPGKAPAKAPAKAPEKTPAKKPAASRRAAAPRRTTAASGTTASRKKG